MPIAICRRLLAQTVRLLFSLARERAGSNIAARIAMMAMTTNNSIKVKASSARAFTISPGLARNSSSLLPVIFRWFVSFTILRNRDQIKPLREVRRRQVVVGKRTGGDDAAVQHR